MTDNANVTSEEEVKNEPIPNPYNAKKSWHTDDVMPKEGLTAESLFVAPQETKQVEEGDQQVEEQEPAEKVKPYSQPNYKKRYDDLKRHYDTKLNEWKQEKELLSAKLSVEAKKHDIQELPKTEEELTEFKEKYPDVYDVVETISALKASDRVKDIESRLEDLKIKEQEKSANNIDNLINFLISISVIFSIASSIKPFIKSFSASLRFIPLDIK